jgi:hypothetical protein
MSLTLNLILQVLGFTLAGTIFWRAESVLNLMSHQCILPIRLAFWLMVVGTASLNVAILRGYVPPATILITLAGLALLLLAERRIGTILRIHTNIPNERRSR